MKYSDKRKASKSGMTADHSKSTHRSLFSHTAAQSKASNMKSGGCKTCGKRRG